MFYQVNRNRSRTGLVCAGEHCGDEWFKLFGGRETFALKKIMSEEDRAVNTLIE